ncbi:uracil-DNA glycosylase [Opitutus sp. ER46]|uniref:uracil-DNA glycosylase n=1 Tax=Opitutus sp. ER46 TaxID=2161864 RepID=UPI000D2FA9C5|nr:uracil-DNA glycosylase [Opitutus sp. ER46]PTX94237.1 uracil-DNA glycosylase [Opitutus sp. ER46]
MRQALQALTDELRRLKNAGVKNVAVSAESVAALRHAMELHGCLADAGTGAASSASAEASPPIRPMAPPPKAYEPPVLRAPEPVVPKVATPALPAQPPPFSLPTGDKAARWAALREIVLNDPICRAQVRPGKKVVLGVGTLDAKIMFVGEAPGAEEEIQGEPFVGAAGQLLTKMIQAMGVKREEVYIGNIMNWRPQLPVAHGGEQVGNRPPTEAEMRYCLPYLRAQIEVVNPDLLVALGATAAQGLLGFGAFKTLGEVRGRWHEFSGKPLMVTYHPSYILRNQSNRSKRMIWEDLLKVMERAGLPISARQQGYFLDK